MPVGTGWIGTAVDLVFLGLVFRCGYEDVRTRRVYNRSVGLLFIYSLIIATSCVLLGDSVAWRELILWLGVSSVAYFFYAAGYIGAGDVKVISAGALFGFVRWGPPFLWAFAILAVLDGFWYRFRERDSANGTPFVWLLAWACLVFTIAVLGLKS